MVAPLRVKMYMLVDYDFSESAIQSASLYPSSIDEYFLYLKGILFGILQVAYTRIRAFQ